MKYTAGTDAAKKIFSGEEWKSARWLLPNGLSFKPNRKFNDKKGTPHKKATPIKRERPPQSKLASSSILLQT
jgi:hypothetical protein